MKKSQKSKVKSQKFIFLAIFFPVMLILFSGVSFAAESLPVSSKAEAALVDFSLQDLNGKTVSSADFKGKPVIMFFWATWCPYCRVEIPVLAKKYNEIKENITVNNKILFFTFYLFLSSKFFLKAKI